MDAVDTGTGISAAFNIPCLLAGSDYGFITKYNISNNNMMGSMDFYPLYKVRSINIIPKTTFATFGFLEASIGLANYDTMVFYLHTLTHPESARV